MRTVEVQIFEFDELSEHAQNHALERYRYINLDHEWWDYIYDDAENIGLRISGFDLGRCPTVDGELIGTVGECCRRIIKCHGKTCDTYKLAVQYYRAKHERHPLSDAEFTEELCELYRVMLEKEFEYLTEDRVVADVFRCNEYEFTVDGEIH